MSRQRRVSLDAQPALSRYQRDTRVPLVSCHIRWVSSYSQNPGFNAGNVLPRGFAYSTKNPISPANFPVYGGVLFAGVDGNPRGIFNSSFGNFGPCLGVAYQLDSPTHACKTDS